MKTFLFINIIITALNTFILIYAYSQDTLVGLAIIFFTMLSMFVWIIYFYYKLFDPLKITIEIIT